MLPRSSVAIINASGGNLALYKNKSKDSMTAILRSEMSLFSVLAVTVLLALSLLFTALLSSNATAAVYDLSPVNVSVHDSGSGNKMIPGLLSLDTHNFTVGELVSIFYNTTLLPPGVRPVIVLEIGNVAYNYADVTSSHLSFKPRLSGKYTVLAKDSSAGQILWKESFTVTDPNEHLQGTGIGGNFSVSTDKSSYSLGTPVRVSISSADSNYAQTTFPPQLKLRIEGISAQFDYNGMLLAQMSFLPPAPGFYKAQLLYGSSIISESEFAVVSKGDTLP